MTIHLITKHPRRFSLDNVKKYLSFQELLEAEPKEDYIVVINSFEEDEYEAGILLGELVNKYNINKLLYLSDKRDLNIASIVYQNKGIVETEDYLSDIDSLEAIIEEIDSDNEVQEVNYALTSTDLSNKDAVGIIQTFYRDVSLGKLDLDNKNYLNIVRQAVKDLDGNVKEIDTFVSRVSTTLNNLYNNAYKNLDDLSKELGTVKQDYHNLSEKFKMLEGIREDENASANSIQSFNSYKVANTYGTKFIVFKEYSSVRYLTSFVMGYKNHLENKLSKRVRLIFVIPNKYNWLEKYKHSPANMAHYSIENDIYRNESSHNNKVGYCEKPISKLYQYFSQLSDDYVIVVDRVHESRPSVIGKVETWHCFSGKTEAELYPNTSGKRILTMKGVTKDDIVIPHISKFPALPAERVRLYDSKAVIEDLYTKMDEKTGITRV